MREIEPSRLWVGNARDARDLRLLSSCGISAVVDLAIEEAPANQFHDFTVLRIPLIDGGDNPVSRIRLAITVAVNLLHEQLTTLVACSGGMSRSPVIAAAALALVKNSPLETQLEWIAKTGPIDVHPLLLRDVQLVFSSLFDGNGCRP